MFKNMKLGMRLGGSFALVLLLMAVIIGVGLKELGLVNDITHKIVDKDWVKAVIANDIIDLANQNAVESFMLFLETDEQKLQAIGASMNARVLAINTKVADLEGRLYLAEGKRLLGVMKEKRSVYVGSFKKSAGMLKQGRKDDATNEAITITGPALSIFLSSINDIVLLQGRILEGSGAEAQADFEEGEQLMFVIGSIAAFIAIFAAFLVTRSITRPLGIAVDVANQMAEGNLNIKIDTSARDEVGMMLLAMSNTLEKLSGTIGQVRANAMSMSSASEEVSATAQSMNQGASEQAASVEETSASIEEMTASITQNTENAKITNDMALQAASHATESGEAVQQTVAAMNEIAKKIGIIDDIAYQTNLLALNAAIEAARAGEHGKGFAVVASEVRKLAERSQVAAEEISEKATGSVEVADKAGKLLSEMVPVIQKTSSLVQEIAAASEEQSASVSQVNNAMEELNKITQTNASASEELAATSEEMSGQSQSLQEMMAFFKVDAGNSSASMHAAPTAAAPAAKQPMSHLPSHSGSTKSPDANNFVKF